MSKFVAFILFVFCLPVLASEVRQLSEEEVIAILNGDANAVVLTCNFDNDCLFNQKCKFGRCVDKDSCSFDSDCQFGNICEFGRCARAECNGGKYDCRSGERCTNHRCERDPFAKRCTMNTDCRTYERCDLGYCR